VTQTINLAKKLDALGHPLRLKIVAALTNREMYLNEIANTVGVSRALAKIHLKKLEKADLVASRIVTAENEAKALRYYQLKNFNLHVSPRTIRQEVENNGQ
jgi:predicted transcriptional regulator